MARLREDHFQSISNLKNPVVFVIDMVKGFVDMGPLHDVAIRDIECNIISTLEKLECKNVFVCDSHPPQTREFDSFPAHCVIGSEEAEVVDSLKPYIKSIMHKNSTNTFTCPDFNFFLENDFKYYNDIVVTGCCTDLCVLHFVLTFNAWLNEHNYTDKRIIVLSDCVETYHIDGVHDAYFYNDVAFKMMQANGIVVAKEIGE